MATRTWFSMKAGDGGTSADIAIYDLVGYWGVDAIMFRQALLDLGDKVTTINLRINSPGGDVYQGVTIHNMLARHPAEVIVTVDGIAASIASLIAMAGKQILMPENAAMLIHNPAGGVYGTADDMDQMAEWLRSIGAGVTNTYVSANRKNLARAEIEAMLAAETWFTAEQAVEKGFADKVLAPAEINMLFDLEELGFTKAPRALMLRRTPPAHWQANTAKAVSVYQSYDDDGTEPPFDAAKTVAAIFDAAGFKEGATPDAAKARPGFLVYDAAAPGVTASYRLPIAEMVNGELRVTKGALDAAAAALAADSDLPDAVKTAAGAVLAEHVQALATLRAQTSDARQREAAAAAVKAAAERNDEILAACELAGQPAKVAREFIQGGKSLDEVRAALIAMAGTGGTGDAPEVNPHIGGGGGGGNPEAMGWTKAISRLNAGREPTRRP